MRARPSTIADIGRRLMRNALCAVSIGGLPIAAAAESAAYRAGALVIEAPWSRATPGGAKVAGGYARVTNTGEHAERLIGATLAGAEAGEVHETTAAGGVMRMRALDSGVVIAPGATVELKPGGYHFMFTGLRRPLRAGESVEGTLVFETAGSVPVAFDVRPVGASGPDNAPAR